VDVLVDAQRIDRSRAVAGNSESPTEAKTSSMEEILDKVRTVTSRMEALLRATEIDDVARHAE
jgi:hypothetical protein